MEIEALRVRVSTEDLNALLKEALPDDQPLEGLHIKLTPDLVIVRGEYPLFISVPFETRWELSIRDGKVAARLARLKAQGLPLLGAQGLILKFLGNRVEKEPWLQIAGDTILLDVDGLLARHGFKARTNLTAVKVEGDSLVLEAASQR